MSSLGQINTVAYIAQTNRDAHVLRDYLPTSWLKSDDTIIPEDQLKDEKRDRIMFYVARQLAGVPTMFMAPSAYFLSGLGGLVAGTVGGFCKEVKWSAPGELKKQWNDWMSCTVILDPKLAKLEKATEGTIACATFVFSWVYSPATGVYSGFVTGASHGWTAGRYLAHRLHPPEESVCEPLFADQSQIFVPSRGDDAAEGSYQPPPMVYDV